jgi:2-dehydro-3-deoxyphosphooctonate aldolase (KDO 8-P synthase)
LRGRRKFKVESLKLGEEEPKILHAKAAHFLGHGFKVESWKLTGLPGSNRSASSPSSGRDDVYAIFNEKMITREISLGSLRLGGANPLFLIAGPCVIESESHARMMAERVAKIASEAGVPYIFKASYDKANRSSIKAFRGPGLNEGLRILGKIKADLRLPILTDIHEASQAAPAAEVADILQIPAFLSRQTDLLLAAAKTGRIVNIKKAQFLSPWDLDNVAEKVASSGNRNIILTERGASFGYNNLVVDMRTFPILRKFGYPVVYDVTHSVQIPGGLGHASGGQPEFIETLARAGVAAGVDGLFLETHDNPEAALSDGPNALPLAQLPQLLRRVEELSSLVRRWSNA